MEKTIKRLRWTAAHSLMNRKDEKGNNIPFSIKFITKDGRIISVPKVIGCYSYNHLKGTRKIQLENGEYRNIYDVLILSINDTKIMVI